MHVSHTVVAKVRFGTAVRPAVVVGQVNVGDAQIEGAAQNVPLHVERLVIAEFVPLAR